MTVGRNKRVVAFPLIRAEFAGNACSRLRSKSLIPAYAINDPDDHSVDPVLGEIEFSTT